MSSLCQLFGVTKQAYYKGCTDRRSAYSGLVEEIVSFAQSVREIDPRISGRKLWIMYKKSHPRIGRDSFERVLSENGLTLRCKRRRVRTTDSRHNLPLYPNLVYNTIPQGPDEIWVSDITYIPLFHADGSYTFCYLSIVMDAYSRQILGYQAGLNLGTGSPLLALSQAIDSRLRAGRSVKGVIHHSDRGVQYASADYTKLLRKNGMLISMTESGNPKDNPQAERINGIVKNELLYERKFTSLSEVRKALAECIPFYNSQRPHMSLGMATPDEADRQSGEQHKCWKSYRDQAIKNLAPQSP